MHFLGFESFDAPELSGGMVCFSATNCRDTADIAPITRTTRAKATKAGKRRAVVAESFFLVFFRFFIRSSLELGEPVISLWILLNAPNRVCAPLTLDLQNAGPSGEAEL